MVTYDIIKEKLLDYHLLTGETVAQAAHQQQRGNRNSAGPSCKGSGCLKEQDSRTQ